METVETGKAVSSGCSGPITANAAALGLRRLDARLGFLGGARQAVAYDARGVRKDVKGPQAPLRCVDAEA